MSLRRYTWCALGLWLGLWLAQPCQAQFRPFASLFNRTPAKQPQAIGDIPLEMLPPAVRADVQTIVSSPTLHTQGPPETFLCDPPMYFWLLDNPDRTMLAWRRLGAQTIEISNRGNGVFGWSDDKGSDVTWRSIYRGRERRIWFAQGKVKPTNVLPMVPVQCVVILKHNVVGKKDKGSLMQHQVDIYVRSTSRAANLATRMLGTAVPSMAQDAAAQMQMFFGAMAWYCHRHPDRVQQLLRPASATEPAASRVMSPFAIKK